MTRIASVFGCLGFVVLMSGCGGTHVQRAELSPAPAADVSVAASAPVDGLPVAPVFSVEGFAGETIALADYRGRYVLLAFWGSWCPHCVDETPSLKRVHAAFGADERFAMLGLSVDTDRRAAREYSAAPSCVRFQF